MKIKVLKKNNEKMDFLLEGANPAFANTLRRIMISEVPTMAVEWVDVHNNTSVLFDEIISHRIGLIPLSFDPSKFVFTEECKCNGKGCPNCQAVFAIEKTGPGMVYSSDMKVGTPGVKPTDPGFPIVKLLPGQELKLEAVACLGKGKDHAKFQAAIASYSYYPEITTKSPEALGKVKKTLPARAFTVKANKIILKDPLNTHMAEIFQNISDDIDVKWDHSTLVFKVETVSGLKPEYIVTKSAEILLEKAEEFKKELSRI